MPPHTPPPGRNEPSPGHRDVIYELFQGCVRPRDQHFSAASRLSPEWESYEFHKKWFLAHMTGEAKRRFDELSECHDLVLDELTYACFRTGFCLGASFAAEAARPDDIIFVPLGMS